MSFRKTALLLPDELAELYYDDFDRLADEEVDEIVVEAPPIRDGDLVGAASKRR